ncbi:MAG: MIP/aquaporin family protein [Candidatus Dadabacteria bacterium]
MKKYSVEFIGTFFLTAGAILGQGVGAALALMIMVYAGGHISGGHYNPAVTLSMYIRRKIDSKNMIGYFIAQLIGATLVTLIIYNIFDLKGLTGDCSLDRDTLKIGLAELFGTFALCFVVLNVATAKGTAGNSFYGLAIGGTVLAMATAFGRFSGGVFNPAVGFGLAVHKSLCWSSLWIYVLAQLIGGAAAAFTFLSVNEVEEEVESIPDADVVGKSL